MARPDSVTHHGFGVVTLDETCPVQLPTRFNNTNRRTDVFSDIRVRHNHDQAENLYSGYIHENWRPVIRDLCLNCDIRSAEKIRQILRFKVENGEYSAEDKISGPSIDHAGRITNSMERFNRSFKLVYTENNILSVRHLNARLEGAALLEKKSVVAAKIDY